MPQNPENVKVMISNTYPTIYINQEELHQGDRILSRAPGTGVGVSY